MPRPRTTHPYSDRGTFERLLILIATLARHPGIGCPDPDQDRRDKHHNALALVQHQWEQVAQALYPDGDAPTPPSTPTIERDLKLLKQYGILQPRMYRWGYYLGTGALSSDELRMALNAIETMGQDQGDSTYRQVHQRLTQRLKGFQFNHGDAHYPVHRNLNQPVSWTDPQEMIEKGEVTHNLFQALPQVEQAILQSQALCLYRRKAMYDATHLGAIAVWPLQIVYYNIGWYLLYQNCHDDGLVIGRIDRFGEQIDRLSQTRSLEEQRQNLARGHQLLHLGWGLKLGNAQEQRLELERKLPLLDIKIRFVPPGSKFIIEAVKRHPTQTLDISPTKGPDGEPTHVDFRIKLPPRSLDEFHLWMVKYGAAAQVLSPPVLKEKHAQWVQSLAQAIT
ncbi:MAG: WYL domain-containing protein [Synechococcaceae cyanobacterium RL_1_2]|nr:WYL domain-containing protein [Synechococcaceae cyanobacterium RL_1_2]